MKLLKRTHLDSLTTFVGSTISSLVIFASPAFALTFGFCGTFTDGAIPGGTVDGKITVDDNNGDFLDFAIITTKDVNGNQERVYTEDDFQDPPGKVEVNHPEEGNPAYRYRFLWNDGTPSLADRFDVYIPSDFFPIDPQNPPATIEPYGQFETRGNILGKDPDKLYQVPEPTTILSSMFIGGAMTLVKKKLKK